MDYHILDSSKKDHEVKVVFHIPVPDENNTAGISLQTALAQYKPFTESAAPEISAIEQTQLENGALYEKTETVAYDGNMNNAQKQAIIDNRYTLLMSHIVKKIRTTLKYWGHSRNVP